MPSTTQGGGYTLTFAKKNLDIKELLIKNKEKGIKITEYVCDAIRFYEKYKNKVNNENVNLDIIENIVNEKLELFKNEYLVSTQFKWNNDFKSIESSLENINPSLEGKINIDDD